MTLLDVLYALRERLIKARNENNRHEAEELAIILDALTVISYQSPNRPLTGILVDLTNAAQDTVMGESWKSTIPSVDEIRTVFASIDEAS
jgi:hypothetical protein